ncbi:hypothetical protein WJX84_004959 [Apatococcus fuscideae]|uniref:Zinc-finger domain-containing protein n=1 Tax=Apatococcus fuscideae TaxID=2026836 RepID=A0AAW1TBW3_9CHLO
MHPAGCRECRTCHFCRQKLVTLMTTCACRNSRYLDVSNSSRGYWCGACLAVRMGENINEVMQNREWRCPCCRGICNCSAPNCCRNLAGLRTTGQLNHEARVMGFNSVAHYLIFTLVNLEKEGQPMADLTNHQQPAMLQPPGPSPAPVFSKDLQLHNGRLAAQRRLRRAVWREHAASTAASCRQLVPEQQTMRGVTDGSAMTNTSVAVGFYAQLAYTEASITAHEDVRDMLRIFTRNILEPVSISAWREVPRSSADLGPPHHLSSHTELRHAVNFLISAAYLLSPAEIDFDIRRLLLNQVDQAFLLTTLKMFEQSWLGGGDYYLSLAGKELMMLLDPSRTIAFEIRVEVLQALLYALYQANKGMTDELRDMNDILQARTREASQQGSEVQRRWERSACAIVLALAQSAVLTTSFQTGRGVGASLQAQLLRRVAGWLSSCITSLLQPSAASVGCLHPAPAGIHAASVGQQSMTVPLGAHPLLHFILGTFLRRELARAAAALHVFLRALCSDVLASVASVLGSQPAATSPAAGGARLAALTPQGADEVRGKLTELLGQGRSLESLDQLQAATPTSSSSIGAAAKPPADQPWTVAIAGLNLLNVVGQLGEVGLGWLLATLPALARSLKMKPLQAKPLQEAYTALLETAAAARHNGGDGAAGPRVMFMDSAGTRLQELLTSGKHPLPARFGFMQLSMLNPNGHKNGPPVAFLKATDDTRMVPLSQSQRPPTSSAPLTGCQAPAPSKPMQSAASVISASGSGQLAQDLPQQPNHATHLMPITGAVTSKRGQSDMSGPHQERPDGPGTGKDTLAAPQPRLLSGASRAPAEILPSTGLKPDSQGTQPYDWSQLRDGVGLQPGGWEHLATWRLLLVQAFGSPLHGQMECI